MQVRVLVPLFLLCALGCQRTNPAHLAGPSPDLGPPIAAAPWPGFSTSSTRIDFGDVLVDGQLQRALTIINTDAEPHSLAEAALEGDDANQFALDGSGCVARRYPGGSDCTLTVDFTPGHAGMARARLLLLSDTGDRTTVDLAGTANAGAPLLKVSPTHFDFPPLEAGSSSFADFGLHNVGDGTASFDVRLDGDDVFQLRSGSCHGQLHPSQACAVSVTFAPKAARAYAAQLVITSSSGPSLTVAIAGTGHVPAALALTASGTFSDQFLGDPFQTVTYHVANHGADATGALLVHLDDTAGGGFVVDSDGCNGQVLSGGAGCDIQVRLAPTTNGLQLAGLSVSGTPGGYVSATLQSTVKEHASLFLQFGNPDFGKVSDSITKKLTFEIEGDELVGPLTADIAHGDLSGFTIATADSTCLGGQVFKQFDTCTIVVAFTARVVGQFQDQLTVAGPPLAAPSRQALHAELFSSSPLRFRPFYVAFGSQLSQPTSRSFTLQNMGTTDATALQLQLTGDGYSLSADDCSGHVLPSGGTCQAQVTFTPTVSGDFSGKLTATNNGDHGVAAFDANALIAPLPFTFTRARSSQAPCDSSASEGGLSCARP